MSIKKIAISAVIGVALMCAAALVFSFLVSTSKLPPMYNGYALISVAIGALAAAFIGAGRQKKLISAVLIALAMAILLFSMGALLFSQAFSLKIGGLVLIILLISCIIGSVISSIFR